MASVLTALIVGLGGGVGFMEMFRRYRLAQFRKKILIDALQDEKYDWRTLATLAHKIAADQTTTQELLIEIGARPSENGKDIWTIK
jgi:hypothetical protein